MRGKERRKLFLLALFLIKAILKLMFQIGKFLKDVYI